MNPEYPWYQVVDMNSEITQGDIIQACPVWVPLKTIPHPNERLEQSNLLRTYNVIVMTQACDIANNKVDQLIVCPIYTMSAAEKANKAFKRYENKVRLKQGNFAGYHLLNECTHAQLQMEFSVVDFKKIYSVPIKFLPNFLKTQEQLYRIRLLPPYREHLSQAFARNFMRIGLPADIDNFPPPPDTEPDIEYHI